MYYIWNTFFLWKLRRLRDSSKKRNTEGAKEIADDGNVNTVCYIDEIWMPGN